jgi:predicted amidophosphoribosyltransferase
MVRLTRATARRLRRLGRDVLTAYPLKVKARADSLHLDAAGRAAAAGFTMRSGLVRAAHGRMIVLVDDVITTGSTLAAASNRLRGAGLEAAACATLAATALRRVNERGV